MTMLDNSPSLPSLDFWLREAKCAENAQLNGMYLAHNGVVRLTPRSVVREGEEDNGPVVAMDFSFDAQKVEAAIHRAGLLPGIFYVRVWLNSGILLPGDDIMLVLVGGDIRPHVIDALQVLVGEIKTTCVSETEIR